jgi:hypothetical protein
MARLQPVVGEVEDVRVVGTLRRPADRPAPATAASPPPSPRPVEHDEAETTLEPAPEPVRDHPRRWEVEAPPLEEHDPAAWERGRALPRAAA